MLEPLQTPREHHVRGDGQAINEWKAGTAEGAFSVETYLGGFAW